MVFWHPKGWTIWQQIEQYMRGVQRDNGYLEVRAPAGARRLAVEALGPLGQFPREHVLHRVRVARLRGEADELPRPRPDLQPGPEELPRPAAALRGIRLVPPQRALRARCTGSCGCGASPRTTPTSSAPRQQVEPEVVRFIDLLQRVYADFGFDEILVKLSTRPAKRVGTDEQWDQAEAALKTALEHKGLAYELQPGEGAFYGPKIEFSLKDSLGRALAMRHDAARFLHARAPRAPNTWPKTTPGTCRSCCTGRSWARSSASSAS